MFSCNRASRSKVHILVLVLGALAQAALAQQSVSSWDFPTTQKTQDPVQPVPTTPQPPQHRFWDRTNILLFSGVAVFRGLDYASTRNFQARGRGEILIPDDVVNNSAGFAGLEAAGAATSVGISYVFHRTGHHKMERWMSITHISVTGFGVVWNYSLKSNHP
jgi:hypothetical protein